MDVPSSISDEIARAVWRSRGQLWDFRDCLNLVESSQPTGATILDFGCGFAFLTSLLSENGFTAYGVDIAVQDKAEETSTCCKPVGVSSRDHKLIPVWSVIESKWPVKLAFYEGHSLPYENDFFDAVIAHAVIEHITANDIETCLSEVWRVLKPGGFFFVFKSPRKSSFAEKLASFMGIEHHDRLLTDDEYANLISRNGFQINCMDVHDLFPRGGLRFQWLVNSIEPLTRIIEGWLLKTRIARFAHHVVVVAQKTD